jgi:three-Cys-motif partner protein
MAKDRWRELCARVVKEDGLPVREVGAWTEEKLVFWNRYIEITTTAMVDSPKWSSGLVYVDLFAGPGVCKLKESGKRIPGSPLIAAYAPKPFKRILLCEMDSSTARACESRIKATDAFDRCHVFTGDCNEKISEIVRSIPKGALTLAFIDPTGLHAKFEAIAALSRWGRVDLLLLFADAYDIVRNVDAYVQDPNSKLDQVLGPESNWRDHWRGLENRSSKNVRCMFADIYKRQLERHLHYRKFGEKTMCCSRGALYRLIYASKHDRGLDFWDKITKKDAGGQKSLF